MEDEKSYEISLLIWKLDQVWKDVNARWGIDRLKYLVSNEMREKWERHEKKIREAIDEKEVATLSLLVDGSIRGYALLEEEALKNGYEPRDPVYWEVQHPGTGSVFRIVKNDLDAKCAVGTGVRVFTLLEVARIIEGVHLTEMKAYAEIFDRMGDKKEIKKVKVRDSFDFENGDEIPF